MGFLGLDFGSKTIGVALSGPSGVTAVGLTVLRRSQPESLRPSLKQLKAIIRENNVTTVVLGNPLHMDGNPSQGSAAVLAFKGKLERYIKGLTVILWDERLSTQAVSKTFSGSRHVYSQKVDEMAAVYILQGYLDFYNRKGTQNKSYNTEDAMTNENEPVFTDDEQSITMYDEGGLETNYQVLAVQKDNGQMYLLVEEITEDGDEGEKEVYHFKCVASEDEDMIFEMIDDEHEDLPKLTELFKGDYEALGISTE
jgi:putative Holliday junction resolvase